MNAPIRDVVASAPAPEAGNSAGSYGSGSDAVVDSGNDNCSDNSDDKGNINGDSSDNDDCN